MQKVGHQKTLEGGVGTTPLGSPKVKWRWKNSEITITIFGSAVATA